MYLINCWSQCLLGTNLLEKARIVIKAIRIIKNWHLYVALYLGFIKKGYVILESRNGIKIKLRVDSTDFMAFTHVWLLEEYSKTGFEIKDTDTIIDIGAHIGLFALFTSQFCKQGKIYCFEPVKENFELLKSNIELNNIKNITPINGAIAKNSGNVTIFLNDDESGHSMYVEGTKRIQVKSFSIQEVFELNKLTKCDFIKMDCEGEEYEIIDSLSTSLFDKINKLCIEYHFVDTKPEFLQKMIQKLKTVYKIETRDILLDIGFLYAKKN